MDQDQCAVDNNVKTTRGSSSSGDEYCPKLDAIYKIRIRKCVPVLISSDSEDESSSSLNAVEKQERLDNLSKVFPYILSEDLKSTLVECNWNVATAVKTIRSNMSSSSSSNTVTDTKTERIETSSDVPEVVNNVIVISEDSSEVKPKNSTSKTSKRKKLTYDGEDDDEFFDQSDKKYQKIQMYDSDDSDDEEESDTYTTATNDKRKNVLDFLQNATEIELKCMQNCSKKKAVAIIEGRPYKTWIDLVSKIQADKQLSTDIINSAHELLLVRKNISTLMNKCTNLALLMEKAVAADQKIKFQPRYLSSSLKLASYQMVGLNWLAVMHHQGVNGILADEMGLGKTVQVIAFLAYLKESGQMLGTSLIIVPSSTLDNWSIEFDRWCPHLRVFVYYGSIDERRQIRSDWMRGLLRNYDVVLTTYTMVYNGPEERKMFRVTPMHYVVFDEAHMLKNMNTQRFENLIRIKATHRILLTGTPLQNNLLELMSLLVFVMPQMFGGRINDLKSLFQKHSGTSKAKSDDIPAFEKTQINQAKRIMRPFVLRRLKKDVLRELPPKKDVNVNCPMLSKQKTQYNDLISLFQSNKRECSKDFNGMTMMMDLRKLSNHPLLLRYYYDGRKIYKMAKKLALDPNFKDTNVQYIIQDLFAMSDFALNQMAESYESIKKYTLPSELITVSGKFAYLDKLLVRLKSEDHRVLLFSQFVIMLDIIEEYLKIRNHRYIRIDGGTPVNTRQSLIDKFHTDENIFIFLLSTKAGGLGINLTAADTVILHDIDFNPYNDKQAEDRCHRLGQQKTVTVYRLISEGTIEEGMFELAKEKLKLEHDITSNENEPSEMRNVVNLLSLALGLDKDEATTLLHESSSKELKAV